MSRERFGQKLLLINLATSCYCVGAAWLAQLNWDLWRYVGNTEFTNYHIAWWHGIWWSIFPVAGFSLIGIFLQLKWKPEHVPAWALWLAVIFQTIIYSGTVLWWGPGQAHLNLIHMADHTINPNYLILANTNWIRACLLTLSGALQFWIALKSFLYVN